MKRTLSPVLLVLFITILFSACSKSSSNPGPKGGGTTLAITSLSANSGPYTTTVTITGTGFSTTAANNQVIFNGHTALVQDASSTQIRTSVPLAAGTGNVTVTVNGATATGPVFTYQVALVVTSVAGVSNTFGSADGKGAAAAFNQPFGLSCDAAGNVYVADEYNNLIRKITPDGTVSTLAGGGPGAHTDGTGSAASFGRPSDVAVDASGNVYVADEMNLLIRKITPSGVVSTLAGNGSNQPRDGQGAAASFAGPLGVAVDGSGNIFVADLAGAGQIRKITPAGLVTTVYSGSSLNPWQLAVDKSGNIYVTDGNGNSIKKITQSGVMTVFAGNNNIIGGDIDGTGTGAAFYLPLGITIDGNGNLFVIDTGNGLIREVTPSAVVTTIGGRSPVNQYGPVTQAVLSGVQGIAVDTNGNIYFTYGNEIRKISMQ